MKKSLLFLITIISSHIFAQNLHLKTGVVVPTQNIGNVRDFNQWQHTQYVNHSSRLG